MLENLILGFLGAGAMAEAMLRGLAGTGPRLLASDPDPGRRAKVAELGVSVLADNRAVAREAQLAVLAVKPQVAPDVLAEIGPAMRTAVRGALQATILEERRRNEIDTDDTPETLPLSARTSPEPVSGIPR